MFMGRKFFLLLALLLCVFCLAHAQGMGEMEMEMFSDMRSDDKAAVVAVHEGVGDEVSGACVRRFNERLCGAWSACAFYEAWISRGRIDGVAGERRVLTLDELLVQLAKDGFTHVLVQPSLLTDDVEMQGLRCAVERAGGMFKHLRVGEPLLGGVDDCKRVAETMVRTCGSEKEANVLMCADGNCGQYALMYHVLRDMGQALWFVGVAEGYPSVESVVGQLKRAKAKRVHLIPFTFASTAQENGEMVALWTRRLKEAGFKVTAASLGLSDMDEVLDLFESHARHAEKYRKYTAAEAMLLAR